MELELIVLVLALTSAGFAAGLVAGLLGVGGGTVLVPVLFQTFVFFDLPIYLQVHMAVGTSLAVICFTGVQSARSHWKLGAVDRDILLSWGVFIAVGALIGAIAARYVSPDGLKLIFATLSMGLGVHMLFGGHRQISGQVRLGLIAQKTTSACIGFLSALMGIGGGMLSVPLLVMAGRSVHKAVGTSAALGVLVAVPATIGFMVGGMGLAGRPVFSFGYVNMLAVAVIIPASMLAAPIGAKLAHRLSQRRLNNIFAGFLLLTGGRMLLAIWI